MSAVVSIRFVSFTFNSSAFLIIQEFEACVQSSAITGNSSIALGTKSPLIVTAFKFGCIFTCIDAVGSAPLLTLLNSMFLPFV